MNRRDIEFLSAYLDGKLKSSDSVKLEARLKTDPELASVLNDLHVTRTLLRKLPSRKAPRNFTLTRKMVGQNPPLPRVYPVFRFATSIATLLLIFSFAANAFAPQFSQPYNLGRGGGSDTESFAESAPAMEAPAGVAEPNSDLASQSIDTSPAEDATRIMETPSEKIGGEETAVEQPNLVQAQEEAPFVSSVWQVGLAVIATLGALLMGLMRQFSARRWK